MLPPLSGVSLPANIRMKVVLPVPFSPIITIISESENCPCSTVNSKLPEIRIEQPIYMVYEMGQKQRCRSNAIFYCLNTLFYI